MKSSRRVATDRISGTLRFFVAAGALGIASPSLAQESQPPVFNWAGLYVGASLGAGLPLPGGERLQAGSGFGSPAFDLYPNSVTRTGVTVGAQAGYNWQKGPWVWGFETDFSLLDGRRGPGGLFVSSPVYPSPPVFTLAPVSSANFFATLRGRAGVAVDRALFYVTGGARGPSTLSINGASFEAPWSRSSRMKYALARASNTPSRMNGRDAWSISFSASRSTRRFSTTAPARPISRASATRIMFCASG